MKKISLIFTFLLIITTAFTAEPQDFIPMQSTQIMRLNAARLVQLPWMMKLLESSDEKCREISIVLNKLKQYNIAPTDFLAGEMWFAKVGASDKSYTGLIKTKLSKVKFEEFFNAEKNSNKSVVLNTTTLAGEKVYTVKYAAAYKAASEEPVVLVYLAEDVLAIMPLTDESGRILTALRQGGGNDMVKKIDCKSLCAMLLKAENRKEKIRSIDARIDLSGQEQRDLKAKIVLSCKNAKTAMRKAMELQFMVPGFAGLLFGNDQQLMQSVTGSLQVVPVNEKIEIDVNLSKALQDKITVYLSNPAHVVQMLKPVTAEP